MWGRWMAAFAAASIFSLISLNASLVGNLDKGHGDFDNAEGVKKRMWMRLTSGCAEYVLLMAVREKRECAQMRKD